MPPLGKSCYEILSRCRLNVFTMAEVHADGDDEELGRINKVIGLDTVVEPKPELLIVLAIWSQYWGENVPAK
jgi:hypothetical protein